MDGHIRLERPANKELKHPFTDLRGWCISKNPEVPFRLSVNGKIVRPMCIERPDVKRVYPDYYSFGFSFLLSAEICLSSKTPNVDVDLTLGGIRQKKSFHFSSFAVETVRAWYNVKEEKRAWCMENLRCPACRDSRALVDKDEGIVCVSCGTVFSQRTSALNMLPPILYKRFDLKETSNVSAHSYGPKARAVVEEVRGKKGKVLDCGAGLRYEQDGTVVNVEIADYPSTDVLAVGQSLPFDDASFDALLSLAVLEHVNDPFACASEIIRVVKPGGKILCIVPFLQPEHGYPNHYYNMTRQGLENLFADKVNVLEHIVPKSGLPIYTLRWFLGIYCQHLPNDTRKAFEKMTVGELISLQKDQYPQQKFVHELSEKGNWALASTTCALMIRK